jgi:hypothetical protein
MRSPTVGKAEKSLIELRFEGTRFSKMDPEQGASSALALPPAECNFPLP